jgi:hypothetical protein
LYGLSTWLTLVPPAPLHCAGSSPARASGDLARMLALDRDVHAALKRAGVAGT